MVRRIVVLLCCGWDHPCGLCGRVGVRGQELNPVTITLWFSLLGCCTTSMLTLATGGYAVPTTLSDGVMISITGLMGFLGQMLMTKGFQLADNAGSASMIRCVV